MAEPIEVRFTVAGLGQTKAAMQEIESSARKTAGAVTEIGQQTDASAGRMRGAFTAMRRSLGDISAGLAGAAAVASLFARNNAELKRQLEVTSLALSGLGTTVRAVTGILRGLVVLVGIKVTAIAALAAAVFFLVRNWETALATGRRLWQTFAAFLARLWSAIVETAKGVGEILAGVFTLDPARIQRGVDQFRLGFGQLRAIAADVGGQIVGLAQNLWGRVLDLFGRGAKTAGDTLGVLMEQVQRWKARQDALIGTIDITSSRLLRQIAVTEEAIRRYEMIGRTLRLTAEQKRRLQGEIEGLRNALIGLNAEWAVYQQRITDVLRAESERALTETREAIEGLLPRIEELTRAGDVSALNRLFAEHAELLSKDVADAWLAVAEANRQARIEATATRNALQESAAEYEATVREVAAANEFDRRQTERMEQAISRQIEAHQRRIDLMDEGVEKLRAEADGYQQLIRHVEGLVVALEAEMAAKIEAGIWTEALAERHERLSQILADLRHQYALTGKAIRDQMLAPIRELRDATERAFSELFSNILSGAKSFGETLMDFFRNIVNAIISILARLAAQWIVLRLFGFQAGGIVRGGLQPLMGPLQPVLAAQHGGIVRGPTLAMVGEGRQAEAIVPLPNNRSIPVEFTRSMQESRPVEVTVRVINVFDREQLAQPDPEDVVATVVNDLATGGPIERVIRRRFRVS